MSDGSSHAARDQERGQNFQRFIYALIDAVENGWAESDIAKVKVCAEACDAVRRGYREEPTQIAAAIDERVKLLRTGDRETWARLVVSVIGSRSYDEIKAISPFADKEFLFVDYGHGFMGKIHGDAEDSVNTTISDLGMCTLDADKYVIIRDKPTNAEVIWLGNTVGDETPYQKDRQTGQRIS